MSSSTSAYALSGDTPWSAAWRRNAELRLERSTWLDHYREIATYINPRSGRFFVTDRNKGDKRWTEILDDTGTDASDTLTAGLASGIVSQARPWFDTELPDRDLSKRYNVRIWLDDVNALLRRIFSRSNTYRTLSHYFSELGDFGTAAGLLLPDFENVIHHTPFTAGEYCLDTDANGNVTVLTREYQMTVQQMVGEFGYDQCSQVVRNLWDTRRGLSSWVTILHIIQPREHRDPKFNDAKNMPVSSCHYEQSVDNHDKPLRESGFKHSPILAPRWRVKSGDVYGNSPGMRALGGIKQLQMFDARGAEAIDFMSRPPVSIIGGVANGRAVDLLPGGVTHIGSMGPNVGIKNSMDMQLKLGELGAHADLVRGRIKRAYYADLFLMLQGIDHTGMTAFEIAKRHEEKLAMLSPVLERLDNELLRPLIERTFEYALAAGLVPPAPPEVQGMPLEIEFVSMLAQAQKAIGTASIERVAAFAGELSKGDPSVMKRLDGARTIDEYAQLVGAPTKMLRSDDEMAAMQEAESRAAEQQMAAKQAQQNASAINSLGNTPAPSQDNALGLALDSLTGTSNPL